VADLDLANIYARHRQGLFTLALLITRRPERAEDAVHEAFARLCGAGDRRGIGDPAAYVFAAVRRAAIDQVRRSKRADDAPGVSIFAPIDNPTPEDDAISAERARSVVEAIEALRRSSLRARADRLLHRG